MPGLFEVDTPRKLYERLSRSLAAFAHEPSEDGIFDIIFPLYHLREWIYPSGYESYKDTPERQRTPEQRLYSKLHAMPEYQTVRDLCNNAKHFEVPGTKRETRVLKGARAGLMRAGDSLGVTHFTVDGREIRKYFDAVAQTYHGYFQNEA